MQSEWLVGNLVSGSAVISSLMHTESIATVSYGACQTLWAPSRLQPAQALLMRGLPSSLLISDGMPAVHEPTSQHHSGLKLCYFLWRCLPRRPQHLWWLPQWAVQLVSYQYCW